jgi:hypothetical protein
MQATLVLDIPELSEDQLSDLQDKLEKSAETKLDDQSIEGKAHALVIRDCAATVEIIMKISRDFVKEALNLGA